MQFCMLGEGCLGPKENTKQIHVKDELEAAKL